MKTTSVVMPKVSQSIFRNSGGVTALAGGRGTAWLGAGLPCSFAGFNFSLFIRLSLQKIRLCLRKRGNTWMGMAGVCPFKSIGPHTVLVVDEAARQVSGQADIAERDGHHRNLIGRRRQARQVGFR